MATKAKTKKKQKVQKTRRDKKQQTIKRKKIATPLGPQFPAPKKTALVAVPDPKSTAPQKLPPKKKDAAEATGPALKRSVSAVVLELDDFDKKSLDGHRVVVQEGIAPGDTTVRLQCKKCGHVDEALLAKFFAVSDDKPPIAYPLEVFKEMVRRLRKKHRGCGGLTTRGIQQSLGLFDEVR